MIIYDESTISTAPLIKPDLGDNTIRVKITANNEILFNQDEIVLADLSLSIDNWNEVHPISGALFIVHEDSRHGFLVEIKNLLNSKKIPTDLQIITDSN